MNGADRLLVLTSCTGSKAPVARRAPVRAERLYTGQQHVRLMRGVEEYRRGSQSFGTLDLRIVSAGHGVVQANESLLYYDDTFSGLQKTALAQRSRELGIPSQVGSLLANRWQLALVLLGDFYLQAASLSPDFNFGGRTLVFASPKAAARFGSTDFLTVVPLDNRHARRFSCGLTSLKGELACRLLQRVTRDGETALPQDPDHVLDWLEDPQVPSSRQSELEFAA